MMTYDGIFVYGKGQNQAGTKGLRLNGLNGSNTVVLNMVEGNLRFLNSADATVLGDMTYEGVVTVDDSVNSRTSFLGIQTRLSTTNNYGVVVSNSNNLVMSDWRQDNNSNGALLTGSNDNPAGRITIQSSETDLPAGAYFLNINNYRGQIFYGTNQMYPCPTTGESIVQTGIQPVEIVLFGNGFVVRLCCTNQVSGAERRVQVRSIGLQFVGTL